MLVLKKQSSKQYKQGVQKYPMLTPKKAQNAKPRLNKNTKNKT